MPTVVETPTAGANSLTTTGERSTAGNKVPVLEVESVCFDNILAVPKLVVTPSNRKEKSEIITRSPYKKKSKK